MKHFSFKKTLMSFSLTSLMATAMAAVDPCGSFSSMSGGQYAQNGGTHDIAGGFNYEMWTNSGNNASMQYTSKQGQFQFKANWNNPDDLLCRIGLYWGNGPKPSELKGDLHCDFNYEIGQGSTGGGYNYIGIYGWTKVPNEVEYYIVENTFFGSTQQQQGLYFGANKVGSYTVDGETYDLWIGTRTNAPSISGTSTFKQVFAVNRRVRKCGHISVSEHIRNWTKHITLGNLYDCKFLCEVGAGSGSFDMKYGNVWVGDYEQTPPEPTEKEEPYKGAIAIPGTLECENYDKGGNGFGYYDTDDENEGKAYRNDGVDIVSLATGGYAVGYTTSSEWLKYTVDVAEDGEYNVGAYMSNGNTTTPKITLTVDDKNEFKINGIGQGGDDWDTYALAKGKINLSKGQHTIVLNFNNDYTNIDKIVFSKDEIQDENVGGSDSGEEGGQGTTPATASGEFFDENGAYFGPECEANNYTGAFYTGNYTSPFKTILGKSDAEIQKKLDQLWDHYFVNNSNKVYFENGNEAYILDTGNNDVRSEGMSYGMMICVQTNHKAQFDKIWRWAKNHMWHNPNQGGDGYFSWSCGTDGSVKDKGCAPDGEMYFMTALLLGANRWNDAGYMKDAQDILKSCWKGNANSLFNETHKIVTFQPSYGNSDFSDPSYDLPAFLEMFVRWSDTNTDKWSAALSATRDHLYKSCNTKSGLFSDYNNFDGTPHGVSFNSHAEQYMYDAMRCAMNYGMDYYLFGKDAKRQTEMAKRIIDFFEKDGYTHARFNWDGSNPQEYYTLGETGANAVACYCLMNEPSYATQVKTNLNKAWTAGLATGTYRYYDGLVHYLSMLHLCGSFKIWKPAPNIEKKEIKGNGKVEFNGVEYTESTKTYAFEDCQLYEVSINIIPTSLEDAESNTSVTISPNPASYKFTVSADSDIELIKVMDMSGRILVQTNDTDVNVSNLSNGTYIVVVTTAEGETVNKLMVIK